MALPSHLVSCLHANKMALPSYLISYLIPPSYLISSLTTPSHLVSCLTTPPTSFLVCVRTRWRLCDHEIRRIHAKSAVCEQFGALRHSRVHMSAILFVNEAKSHKR